MSQIHYFQRYSAKENWITNATLLLLSRLYHFSPKKFEIVLNSFLSDAQIVLNIGVNFSQQEWSKKSVVDGLMFQESFELIIETKLSNNFNKQQLVNHLSFLNNKSQKNRVLITLSKDNIEDAIKNQIQKVLYEKKYSGISFASITYEQIYRVISSTLHESDYEMTEVLEDYFALCNEQKLINTESRTLLGVTAGQSLNENLQFNLYYDPANRTHSHKFKYIGLYSQKSIVAIGKITKEVVCDLKNNKLVAPTGKRLNLTQDEQKRIYNVIVNTKYFNLKQGSRFFLVDNFYKTNFTKTSFSSLRGKKYFWLDEISGFKEGMTAKDLALLLNNRHWE